MTILRRLTHFTFFEVGEDALSAVVATANPNAAFDFEESAAGEMGEVRTPAAGGMEAGFTLQSGSAVMKPKLKKRGFEA